MKKTLVLLTVLVVIFVFPCRTSNAQIYKFQQYTAKQGLRYDFVYSMAQDKHGYIWFATGLGL